MTPENRALIGRLALAPDGRMTLIAPAITASISTFAFISPRDPFANVPYLCKAKAPIQDHLDRLA